MSVILNPLNLDLKKEIRVIWREKYTLSVHLASHGWAVLSFLDKGEVSVLNWQGVSEEKDGIPLTIAASHGYESPVKSY